MNIKWIEEHGRQAQGKAEFIEYLNTSQKLSPVRAIKAQCYQCMNCYADGKVDCKITDCPLYAYMPYRKDKIKTTKPRTERQKQAITELVNLRSKARRNANASE